MAQTQGVDREARVIVPELKRAERSDDVEAGAGEKPATCCAAATPAPLLPTGRGRCDKPASRQSGALPEGDAQALLACVRRGRRRPAASERMER